MFPEMLAKLKSTGDYVGPLSKQFALILFQTGLRSHSPYDRVSKGAGRRRWWKRGPTAGSSRS